jgi:hypothetical protein
MILDVLHFNKEYKGEHEKIVIKLKEWFYSHNCNEKDNYNLSNLFI